MQEHFFPNLITFAMVGMIDHGIAQGIINLEGERDLKLSSWSWLYIISRLEDIETTCSMFEAA